VRLNVILDERLRRQIVALFAAIPIDFNDTLAVIVLARIRLDRAMIAGCAGCATVGFLGVLLTKVVRKQRDREPRLELRNIE